MDLRKFRESSMQQFIVQKFNVESKFDENGNEYMIYHNPDTGDIMSVDDVSQYVSRYLFDVDSISNQYIAIDIGGLLQADYSDQDILRMSNDLHFDKDIVRDKIQELTNDEVASAALFDIKKENLPQNRGRMCRVFFDADMITNQSFQNIVKMNRRSVKIHDTISTGRKTIQQIGMFIMPRNERLKAMYENGLSRDKMYRQDMDDAIVTEFVATYGTDAASYVDIQGVVTDGQFSDMYASMNEADYYNGY